MNLFLRFIKYQSIRFPLKILGFTTLASVLSSAAIMNYQVSLWQILVAYAAIILLMFHIRVNDESRDFKDDKTYHPELPIHSGLISLKQLYWIDFTGIAIVIAISFIYGLNLFYLTLIFFAFTTLAWKDFFIRNYFKGKNVLYHIVNSPQMIILQLYIFTIFTGKLEYTTEMWILVLFMYINVFILEIVRKIKIDSEESNTNDTYSSTLGYKRAILFLYLLCLVSMGIYFWLMLTLNTNLIRIAISVIPFLLLISLSVIIHINRKSQGSEKILLLSTILQYVGLNTFICIFQL